MTTFLRISARDPLVARDGRPFGEGQGNRMHSSGWLTPSVVAGSFRTALAKAAGRGDFKAETQDELLKIEVAGVLPFVGGELYLPAPNDCVLDENGNVLWARPMKMNEDEGADWPGEGLWPVLLNRKGDFKPQERPAFWPMCRYVEWLTEQMERVDLKGSTFLGTPLPDLRDHVHLNPESGAAKEGHLFTTVGIGSRALPKHGCTPSPAKPTGPPRRECFAEIELSARVGNVPAWGSEALANLSVWHPLGGERRLAHWQTADDGENWKCPPVVREKLGTTKRITMTLATPAFFRDGWKPGWLDQGSPTGDGPRLTLVGVCIQRWRAVSGWSYQKRGPKRTRRMVPAGGVYFFESEREDNSFLADQWLRPISDDEQERRDGFGLAVWGTW